MCILHGRFSLLSVTEIPRLPGAVVAQRLTMVLS